MPANPTIPFQKPTVNQVWNVPNQITSARILLAIIVFALLPFGQYWAALAVFILAAATDWVDGYWARKYNQVTKLGRILDPFADKMIICGAFISLVAIPGSGIAPWIAIVVIGRELLVTSLRAMIESQGGDFSANLAGKLKMAVQCVAVGASMLALQMADAAEPWRTTWYGLGPMPGSNPAGMQWPVIVLTVSLWLAVVLTIQSGVAYIAVAIKMNRKA